MYTVEECISKCKKQGIEPKKIFNLSSNGKLYYLVTGEGMDSTYVFDQSNGKILNYSPVADLKNFKKAIKEPIWSI